MREVLNLKKFGTTDGRKDRSGKAAGFSLLLVIQTTLRGIRSPQAGNAATSHVLLNGFADLHYLHGTK